ncbi:MAG TPA: ribosome-associated translation inhibitor RaiA [Chlamydiales bacterium]|nr:ribosome-associated translation inhibitor RaiA [Chlamydiales bacterium]
MAKPNKFSNDGYIVSILGNHIEITDAIRNYVWEKLSRIDKIADAIIDIQVTLDAQKLEQSCSILMDFNHFHLKVKASTDNMYSAIDRAIDRVTRLIRKYKAKLQSHRSKDVSTVDIHVNVILAMKDDVAAINDEIEAENAAREQERFELHRVVAKETMPLKTLTQDEAVMKMEITDEPFLIYRSEEDLKMKVIYRRKDQNYGLVQVQQ